MESSAKTGKFLIRGSQERKRCTFLGQKHESAIWDRTTPHLHIKPSLYVCRKVQGSQIFKQNRIISISSRLIEFWCFGLPAALGMGGGWMWCGVVGGCSPHMCTCTCMYAHTRMVNMIISCKWPPPLGESLGVPYDVICTCVCLCMCVCMHVCGGHPLTTPHPHPSTSHPPGGPPESLKIQ